MSKQKNTRRLRIFAGPNGSGKSTIITEIAKLVRTGTYVNADDIEKKCRQQKFLNLADYGLQSTPEHFEEYLTTSTLLAKAIKEGFQINLSLKNNIIVVDNDTNSYEASLIAAYLRSLLIESGTTFSFETVMSHRSKLDTLKTAASAGYKNYLYFISTEDPSINEGRVEARVKKGGHGVPPDKIRERYYRSVELLAEMVPLCHRCFVFDNSGTESRLIVEIVDGTEIRIHTSESIPAWVETYLLKPLGV